MKTVINNRYAKVTNLVAIIFFLTLVLWHIALIVLVLFWVGTSTKNIDWPRTWENWDNATSAFEHIATVAALIVGGLFAYYKFFKGRVFVPRLATGLSIKSICNRGTSYLIASLELKNVGLSRIDIHQKGTALRISLYDGQPSVTRAQSVPWRKLKSFPVFERHKWIEAGETIKDELMVATPTCDKLAFRLEFRIIGSRTELTSNPKRFAWRVVRIIEQTPENKGSLTLLLEQPPLSKGE